MVMKVTKSFSIIFEVQCVCVEIDGKIDYSATVFIFVNDLISFNDS